MTASDLHVGRREIVQDWSDRDRVARLAATLDHATPPWRTNVLPPLGHWLFFLPRARQAALGSDGHPARTDDGLLPNVDLPRRMWAGSRIRFLSDIPLDTAIVRNSTLVEATPKNGRTGNLLFVTVRHEISAAGAETAIVEEQDLVYRGASLPATSLDRKADGPGDVDPVVRTFVADPVLLFRYSALTFNSHRIHYDRDYAREEEGYPGLVVQGPLLATLMLDQLVRLEARTVTAFSFRATAPSFAGEELQLGLRVDGNSAQMRVINPAGIAMTGLAELAP